MIARFLLTFTYMTLQDAQSLTRVQNAQSLTQVTHKMHEGTKGMKTYLSAA